MADIEDVQVKKLSLGPEGGDLPASGGGGEFLTVDERKSQIDAKGMKNREKDAAEISAILASSTKYKVNQYGRFRSIIDLSGATEDENGMIQGAKYLVQPSDGFADLYDDNLYDMGNYNKADLLKEGNRRDDMVRRSANLQFWEGRRKDGTLVHGETTEAARALEETVYSQLREGLYDAAPIAAAKAAYSGTSAIVSPLRAVAANPLARFVTTAGPLIAGATAFGYGIAMQETYRPDMAQKIFDAQNQEIKEKTDAGYYTDVLQPRILTLEEIRDRLDPEFAPFKTKLVNTMARNSVSSATSLIAMGGLYVKPLDKALNVITGGRVGAVANATKKAELHFINANREAAKQGINLKPATPDMIKARVKIELLKDIESEKNQMWGSVFRFINTFPSKQKLEQLSNPLRYGLSALSSEIGANTAISFAAYESYLGSGRTEELGKMPFGIGGALLVNAGVLGTTSIGGAVVGTTRLTLGLIGSIGDLALDSFQNPLVTRALIGENKNKIFNFLSGQGDLKDLDLSKMQYAGKEIDPAKLRKSLISIREMIVQSNVSTGGEIIDQLRISAAAVEEITGMINASGNKELIAQWKPEYTMGVLLKFDVAKAMQVRFLQAQIGVSPSERDLGTSIAEQFGAIKNASNKTLSQANALMAMLMDGDMTAFSNKPAYKQYVQILSKAMDKSQKELDDFEQLSDNAVMYRWNDAVSKLMVTAEKEGLSENTLKQAEIMEEIITDNPMFGKLLDLTDTQSQNILDDAGKLQNFKDEIHLAIREIYKNAQGADRNLDELYDVSKGKGNIGVIAAKRSEDALDGQRRASSYAAWNMMGQVKHINKQSKLNYDKIGETPDDGYIDVTDMWVKIQADDLGKDSLLAEDQMSGVSGVVNKYFKTNVRSAVDSYFDGLGSGNAGNGYKFLKKAIKDKIITPKTSLPSFNRKEALAMWLSNPKNMEDLNEIGPVFRIKINIDEAEQLTDKFKFLRSFYTPKDQAQFPSKNKKVKADTARLWSSIEAKFKEEVMEKLPRINQERRQIATDYFRETVVPMRDTWFWKQSWGSIKNADVSSVTGYSHGVGMGDRPASWLDEFFKLITNKKDGARNARVLWNDFTKFYGPPEIKLPDGKVVRNDKYHNALEAISDYFEFRVHASSEGMLYDSSKKGKGFSFGVEPDETSPKFKEQSKVMKRKPGETIDEPLTDITFGKTADGTPFDQLKYDDSWSAIINWEKASSGAFQQTLSYSSAREIDKIMKLSEAGGKIIKQNVETAQLAIADAIVVATGVKSTIKLNARKIQDVLGLNYGERGNTAKMVESLLANPENYDVLVREIGQTTIGGVIYTPQMLLQQIVTDGLVNLTKGNLTELATKFQIPEVMARTDGLVMKYLMDQNPALFEQVFTPEHLSNIKKVNNFLLRFVSDDVLNPAGGGTMGLAKPDAGNIQYSNSKIMNRIWTTQIGKTTKAWLGIEAAAAMMFNTDSSAFGAILLSEQSAEGFLKFLTSGKLSPFTLDPSKLSWFDKMVGGANSAGTAAYQVAVDGVQEGDFFMWLEDTGLDSTLSDKTYGKLRAQYEANVGGNALRQGLGATRDYLGVQMQDLF